MNQQRFTENLHFNDVPKSSGTFLKHFKALSTAMKQVISKSSSGLAHW